MVISKANSDEKLSPKIFPLKFFLINWLIKLCLNKIQNEITEINKDSAKSIFFDRELMMKAPDNTKRNVKSTKKEKLLPKIILISFILSLANSKKGIENIITAKLKTFKFFDCNIIIKIYF